MHILSLEEFLIDYSTPIKFFIKRLILREDYKLFDKYIEYIIYHQVVIKGEKLKNIFKVLDHNLFNNSYIYNVSVDNRPRLSGFFERYTRIGGFVKMGGHMCYSKTDMFNVLYNHLIEKFNYYKKLYNIKTTKPFIIRYTGEEYIKIKRKEKINKYKDDENFNPFKCQEGNRDIKNGDYTLLYLYIYKEIVKGVKNEGYNNFNSVIESLKYKIFGDNYDNTFYCYISDRNYGYLEFNEFSDDYNLGVEGYYYIKMQFKLLVEKMRKKLNPENNN